MAADPIARRPRPGHVAAPASLLAFAAWQSMNGALAHVGLDGGALRGNVPSVFRQSLKGNGRCPSLTIDLCEVRPGQAHQIGYNRLVSGSATRPDVLAH